MKFLLSQPSTKFYAWQSEILLQNLLDHGINLNDVEIVCSGNRSVEWDKLAKRYAARFFFYPNTSKSNYPSITRPNALRQHYRLFPDLSNETVFYCDSDILFLQSPYIAFRDLFSDNINYVSDCKWYIGYSYFKTKEKQVTKNKESYDIDKILQELCNRVNLDVELLKSNDDNSGGAQYILKGIDYKFWEEVEQDCNTIYNYFNYSSPGSVNQTYFSSENEGIQSFCSDMWAILFNLWKRNKEVRIAKQLEFAWPGWDINQANHYNILHMAGVCSDKERLFFKSKYTSKLPYNDNFDNIDPGKLSYVYTEKVKQLKNTTCLN